MPPDAETWGESFDRLNREVNFELKGELTMSTATRFLRKLVLRQESRQRPSYDADRLRVWDKGAAFMQDPRFQEAYRRGMFSGHKLGRRHDVDLHIEWRVHTILWAATQASKLAGDFVECGVNTGIYSLAICEYLNFNLLDKSFYLFDTFSGVPEEQLNDAERQQGHLARLNRVYEECYETACRNFAEFPNAVLVRGRVPETLTSVPIKAVSYLSIDMNIVEPEIAALEHFWPLLTPGAPVVLDDYGWDGHVQQRLAMDEFAQGKGLTILEMPTGQGLLIKPPA